MAGITLWLMEKLEPRVQVRGCGFFQTVTFPGHGEPTGLFTAQGIVGRQEGNPNFLGDAFNSAVPLQEGRKD